MTRGSDRLPRPALAPGPLLSVLFLLAFLLAAAKLAAVLPLARWGALLAAGNDPAAIAARFAVLPRLVVALLAGAALGLSGGLMQAALRNPLASPGTLGVSAGAQLALAAATLGAPELLAVPGRDAVAFVGAAAAAGLVLLLAARSRLAPLAVLLCGLLVALAAGSFAGVLATLHSRQLSSLFVWAGGSLVQDGWGASLALSWRLALGAALVLPLLRPLRLLDLPDAAAGGLGISVACTRLAALLVAIGLAASTVALVGVIGFVGLAGPVLARLLRPGPFSPPRCALFGAGLLALTDGVVALLAGWTAELLPTGAVTALLGAPLLLLLLRRAELAPGALPLSPPGRAPAEAPALASPVLCLLGVVLLVATLGAVLFGRNDVGWSIDPALLSLRLPRATGAAVAGAALGVAGLVLQRVLRNPVASPDVIGIGTGTVGGVAAAIWFGAAGPPGRLLAGAAGGAAAVLLLLLFGRGGAAPTRMLLAGLALGSAFEGVLALLLATGDPRADLLLVFLSGTTYFLDAPTVAGATLCLVLVGGAVLLLHRVLDALLLGDEVATGIGVPTGAVRVALLLLAAVLAGTATLLAGPLSFVGLVAPHGARRLGLRRAASSLAGAALLGAAVMVLADWLGRTVLFPAELPAGAVAALLGGPLLLLSFSRRR